MITWKETITRRFDAAADTYDGGAESQRRIALALCQRVLEECPDEGLDVLEIGCGTGFLTRALAPVLPGCRWVATDISPRMVETCAARMDLPLATRVMDGERPDLPEQSFDLIVSSMAIQWFADLAAGLGRLQSLLRPGGLLAVNTLGSDTFREWRDVCHAAGVEPATPVYPSFEELRRMVGPGARILQQAWPLPCSSLKGFLAHLKATGARAADPSRPPLPPSALCRVLRTWEGRPFTATYDVLTVLWRKEA